MNQKEKHYVELVEKAIQERNESQNKLQDNILALNSFTDFRLELDRVAETLNKVNEHIKIEATELENASDDYKKIAESLITNLGLPKNSVQIIPQGSASTKTLIRTPDNTNFDIDAVCIVNIHMDSLNPIDFYDSIGEGLSEWKPTAKKRCWKINCEGKNYYIEITPSTYLGNIPEKEQVKYKPNRYSDTALAVVDTPTKQWKTSNPQGFKEWVSEQAQISLLVTRHVALNFKTESVDPIPNQDVHLADTLRVAIRLLKRHRDISIRRNCINPELKPISIIITTLLTKCYEGLSNLGKQYHHPINLLIELVDLMPYMIERKNNELWIANPTVDGENFAEKWNENHLLEKEFKKWAKLLKNDLKEIMNEQNEEKKSDLLMEVFGCTGAKQKNPPDNGLMKLKPTTPVLAPESSGLA